MADEGQPETPSGVRLLRSAIIGFVVVALIGALARRSRRRNMGRYGQAPGRPWQSQAPPPSSPYAAWNSQQQGHPQQGYPRQQGHPQQGYPQQPA
jgi:hypothetical protein